MLHGIQQLIFVDEMSDHEISKAGKEHPPRVLEDAVDNTNDKDEDCLGQEEPVAENRRLY